MDDSALALAALLLAPSGFKRPWQGFAHPHAADLAAVTTPDRSYHLISGSRAEERQEEEHFHPACICPDLKSTLPSWSQRLYWEKGKKHHYQLQLIDISSDVSESLPFRQACLLATTFFISLRGRQWGNIVVCRFWVSRHKSRGTSGRSHQPICSEYPPSSQIYCLINFICHLTGDFRTLASRRSLSTHAAFPTMPSQTNSSFLRSLVQACTQKWSTFQPLSSAPPAGEQTFSSEDTSIKLHFITSHSLLTG